MVPKGVVGEVGGGLLRGHALLFYQRVQTPLSPYPTLPPPSIRSKHDRLLSQRIPAREFEWKIFQISTLEENHCNNYRYYFFIFLSLVTLCSTWNLVQSPFKYWVIRVLVPFGCGPASFLMLGPTRARSLYKMSSFRAVVEKQ